VLVCIDDLHFACADSLMGLSALLSDRQVAPLLILLTSRFGFDDLREVASNNPKLSVHELTLSLSDWSGAEPGEPEPQT
jgi:hypothetical protein